MNDWHDIESLALHDPVLHAAVTRVRQGASREEALIAAVKALSEQVAALRGARTDALYFGNGFVTVTHASGEFRYRRVDPASVRVHDREGTPPFPPNREVWEDSIARCPGYQRSSYGTCKHCGFPESAH